jgi:hypothetical protein
MVYTPKLIAETANIKINHDSETVRTRIRLSEIARILSRKKTFHVLKTNLFSVLLKILVKAIPAIIHNVPVSINGGNGRKN